MEPKVLGSRLKSLRKLTGLSRNYIEQNFNISATSIKIWETSEHNSISVANLMKYLEVFKSRGMFISLDLLFDKDKDFLLDYSSDTLNHNRIKNDYITSTYKFDFLKTSFGKSLLKMAFNIVFYANSDKKIVYLNPNYQNLVNKNSCNKDNNELVICDVIPQVANNDTTSLDLQNGKSVIIEFRNDQQYMIQLQINPNLNEAGDVAGFTCVNLFHC